MKTTEKSGSIKKPQLIYSVCALLSIVAFTALGYLCYKINFALLLFMCWLLAAAFAMPLGYKFSEIEDFAYKGAKNCIGPAAIIIAVGMMIGSFMAAGTVPSILAVGLKVITPGLFLPIVFLLCIATSLVTGTSWGTIGTVGVAMIGVGAGLQINPAVTAGAIVSGAYFGDKMSPVSDSTILSSTLTGTDIWVHIKHMLYTTVPGAIISIILYAVIGGVSAVGEYDPASVNGIVSSIHEIFKIDIISFLPIVLVVVLIVCRKSTIGALMLGAFLAALIAVFHQGYTVTQVGQFMYSGYKCDSADSFIAGILNRGGITSMLSLIAMFISALGLGGILSETQMLQPIFEAITQKIKSAKGVLLMAWIVVWLCVIIVPTYNFAFVVVSTLFTPLLAKYNLKSENLSRILEDVGTLGGNLFPWCVGPVYASGVLGVATTEYAPYVFLSIFVPIISLIYILLNFKITYTEEAKS